MSSEFSSDTRKARDRGAITKMKTNPNQNKTINYQPRILYPEKYIFQK